MSEGLPRPLKQHHLDRFMKCVEELMASGRTDIIDWEAVKNHKLENGMTYGEWLQHTITKNIDDQIIAAMRRDQ